jgi:hypothetical protein
MFFQLLFIHLFRPFLKYTQATSPLPHTVSPRKLCTQAAAMISKLMRLYKRSHGLRQICNIAVYIVHSACTIHLLNLPDKNAKRDIVHGVKHLEEIAESWLCARRTLVILSTLATKWKVDLPEEATVVLARTDAKFSSYHNEVHSPAHTLRRPSEAATSPSHLVPQTIPIAMPKPNAYNLQPYPSQQPVSTSSNLGAATSTASQSQDILYSAPPKDAYSLRPSQLPSAATTPGNTSQIQRLSADSRRAGTSPSDMFGGVEQLLRDSQDWAYRDQAQLATGFENWHPTETDAATWGATPMVASAAAVDTAMPRQLFQAAASGASVSTPTTVAAAGYVPAASANSNGVAPQGGVGMDGMMTDWLESMNAFNSMAAGYNEDEWYR